MIRNNSTNIFLKYRELLSQFILVKLIILPSSFTSGNRYFQQKNQDSIGICKEIWTSVLLITFTCNSRCEEIKKELQHVEC